MNIGSKIKELRKQRGVTQEQLADSIGVSFQAVSKWENNITLPDITLAPALANYFGVSMDTLFDFNVNEIDDKAFAIAKESWKYRDSDWEKAREIIDEGLKTYPDNVILLLNRLYVMDDEKTPDEVITTALKVIDLSKDEATKYDACRFLAFAYKSKGDLESARKAIDIIPDIRFSNQGMKACILQGEEKWDAACQEFYEALYALMFITYRVSECLEDQNDYAKAMKYYDNALRVLDIYNINENWHSFRESFNKRISKIKEKVKDTI